MNMRCVIIVSIISIISIISFHQKGERERDPRSLSRAHRARATQPRWERYKTKNLSRACSYSYLKLTHIIRCNQSRRTAHTWGVENSFVVIIVSRRVLLPSSPFTNKRINTTTRERPQNALASFFSCLFLFVSRTDSYCYSLRSKPPHGSSA